MREHYNTLKLTRVRITYFRARGWVLLHYCKMCLCEKYFGVSGLFRWGRTRRTCRTCRTNCGVVVDRRVTIIAAVNGITLAVMRIFRPKRNLRVHPLDATTERFRGDFPKMFGFFRNWIQKCSAFFGIDSKNVRLFSETIPKMFGFLYARCVGFATGIAVLTCRQKQNWVIS